MLLTKIYIYIIKILLNALQNDVILFLIMYQICKIETELNPIKFWKKKMIYQICEIRNRFKPEARPGPGPAYHRSSLY